MQTLSISLTFLTIFSVAHTLLCKDTCEPTSCSPIGPSVRFPFRLGRQSRQCGYPDFDLSCNNKSQLMLNLPFAGHFVVTDINYKSQTIFLEPKFCPPPRLDTFSPFGSPFDVGLLEEYTFFNCSSTWFFPGVASFEVVDCVDNVNGTVVAVPSRFYNAFRDRGLPESCTSILWTMDIPAGLRWSVPFCGRCERENGTCGYKNVETLEIGCSVSSKTAGLSTAAKYGITIGAGLPGLFLLVCLVIYARKKIDDRSLILQQHHVPNLPATTVAVQPPRFAIGLDKLTIDSYPMTVLGESKRLPKPSDSVCAICLSEYKPNDTLRTVPECNHYFHSNCIDEWLKLNATCPICRNLPEGSLGRAAPPLSSSSSSNSLFSNHAIIC